MILISIEELDGSEYFTVLMERSPLLCLFHFISLTLIKRALCVSFFLNIYPERRRWRIHVWLSYSDESVLFMCYSQK